MNRNLRRIGIDALESEIEVVRGDENPYRRFIWSGFTGLGRLLHELRQHPRISPSRFIQHAVQADSAVKIPRNER